MVHLAPCTGRTADKGAEVCHSTAGLLAFSEARESVLCAFVVAAAVDKQLTALGGGIVEEPLDLQSTGVSAWGQVTQN